MKSNAEEIAELFDAVEINLEDNGESKRSFNEKCDTIKTMMKEEATKDKEIIQEAISKTTKKTSKDKKHFKDNPKKEIESYDDEVDRDIKKFELETVNEHELETENEPEFESEVADDNPLGLKGQYFRDYQYINKKYDQFIFYDGTVSFKSFYRYKFETLRHILFRFGNLLDVSSLMEELKSIKVDHFTGDRAISPSLIQRKLDDCFRSKARLSSVLIMILEQYPMWDRFLEIMKGKLWKDHELKGVHRRDGLVAEHLSDVEKYVQSLKGLLDSARNVEGILKSANDSLSRQLACLQLAKEATGFISKELDDLDSIGNGETIKKTKASEKAPEYSFGVGYSEDDDLDIC